MKALAFKELRDVCGITLIALGCYLALVVNLMGAKIFDWVPGIPSGTHEVPFTGMGFVLFFNVVAVVSAVALGFRQSAWESARGTYLFLLHRPVSRRAIFLLKLAIGLGVLMLSALVPILLYGWWASVPGHHPSPFSWSIVWSGRGLFLIPLWYLGAFLSGLRPARWLGTRLLPLVAAGLFFIVLSEIRWWHLGFSVTVVLYALLVGNICFVARVRDYA
jgi:hypothetical protein